MSEVILALFVVAFGFVTAAIFASLVGWAFGQDGKISLSFASLEGAIKGILFFMISGPYLIMSNGMQLWRRGDAPTSLLGFCCLTSLFWSFCLGVMIIQLLVVSGVLTPQFN